MKFNNVNVCDQMWIAVGIEKAERHLMSKQRPHVL